MDTLTIGFDITLRIGTFVSQDHGDTSDLTFLNC